MVSVATSLRATWHTFQPNLAKQKKKIHLEKISYIFSKKVFLIFRKIQLSSTKIKNFQQGPFQAQKIKKNPL